MTTPVFGRRDPDGRGYFGPYGGRFVPETLVAPVEALARAYDDARGDPAFATELDNLLERYVGRPTPITEAARLRATVAAEAGVPTDRVSRILLKREDLAHTGAHKINNALGQALLAVRMGEASHRRGDGGRAARRRNGDRLCAARPRLPGIHGDGGHGATGAQCLPDAFARCAGDGRRRGKPDAEGRD